MNRPPPGAPRPDHSGMAIAGFVVAAFAFVAGLIPFAGFLGIVGVVLCVIDLTTAPPGGAPRKRGLSYAGVVLGALSTLGAIAWVIAIVWLDQAAKAGSCPHLYAYDGSAYRLDADLASGALYRGAEREDLDRLESLRAVDGAYRLRLANDLEEVDFVDTLELLVVDAPLGTEVLPTQSGALVAVRAARPPLSTARASLHVDGNPRDAITYEFSRPSTDRALLVVRARNTRFAEAAFVRYMATMGQGVRPLMELRAASDESCACYQRYITAEIERMGFPLWISVGDARASLQPVGPAVLRAQALPIDLPRDAGDRVRVRLEATPRFWEIASVELAPYDPEPLDVRVLAPVGPSSALLGEADGHRASLRPGEHLDVRFDAPPPPADGRARTVVARLRGYYDLDIGGPAGVNVARMIAHRAGWVSLPRFAERLGSARE